MDPNLTLEEILARIASGVELQSTPQEIQEARRQFENALHKAGIALADRVLAGAQRVRESSAQSGMSLVRSFVYYMIGGSDRSIETEIREALGLGVEDVEQERSAMGEESRRGAAHAVPHDLMDRGRFA